MSNTHRAALAAQEFARLALDSLDHGPSQELLISYLALRDALAALRLVEKARLDAVGLPRSELSDLATFQIDLNEE
ncbi:hypothetical protein B2G71_03205 [Novosphingobium sp. PC22D]|uniref:hypothetical protein n=1 Tax=Novosphingobium sp. PC22D TaxID=1962403 RepID=UPI000BF0252F|nr:hypothetical protein [Novosphingobium sp. PC22D]PEQ14590.1 hypothetical protein B2G71_03205 [Novosphingobium sp. PC22D]